jgi:hypothetical protein
VTRQDKNKQKTSLASHRLFFFFFLNIKSNQMAANWKKSYSKILVGLLFVFLTRRAEEFDRLHKASFRPVISPLNNFWGSLAAAATAAGPVKNGVYASARAGLTLFWVWFI